MSAVRALLDDLRVIGATLHPSGERLILRAGPEAVPGSLVRRIRECKSELITALAPAHSDAAPGCKPPSRSDLQARIVEWLNHHPAPSTPGRCAWCGKLETDGAVVVPFGTEPGSHAWLHAECWRDWHRERCGAAMRALDARAP